MVQDPHCAPTPLWPPGSGERSGFLQQPETKNVTIFSKYCDIQCKNTILLNSLALVFASAENQCSLKGRSVEVARIFYDSYFITLFLKNAPLCLKFGHSKFLYMHSTVLQVHTQLYRHDQAQRRLQRLEETVKLLEQQLKEKRNQIAVCV